MNYLRSIFFATMSLTVAEAAPNYQEIKLFDNAGKEQRLTSSKDKLLVVLWATWCPDCKSKMKGDLKNLKDDPGIELLALNTEKNIKRVGEFLKEENIGLPVAFDRENQFRKSLELFAVPAWAVFDRQKDGSLVLVAKGSPFEAENVNVALAKKVFK